MPTHAAPPSDQELRHLEALALDATPGPWEPQLVLDLESGEASRAVVRAAAQADECRVVVEPDAEMAHADQLYIAGMHPDATLRLVHEVRRLRGVEDRLRTLLELMGHLNDFLDQRGLAAQAARFVEIRSQVAQLHPELVAPRPAGVEAGAN